MRILRPILTVLMSVAFVGSMVAAAQAKPSPDVPAAGTFSAGEEGSWTWSLVEGMKSIKSGDHAGFMKTHCHDYLLCHNETAKSNLKRNLQAMERLLKYEDTCLKAGDTFVVTQVKEEKSYGLKVYVPYLKCRDGGMPRPFKLAEKKGGGKYMWTKVY